MSVGVREIIIICNNDYSSLSGEKENSSFVFLYLLN